MIYSSVMIVTIVNLPLVLHVTHALVLDIVTMFLISVYVGSLYVIFVVFPVHVDCVTYEYVMHVKFTNAKNADLHIMQNVLTRQFHTLPIVEYVRSCFEKRN